MKNNYCRMCANDIQDEKLIWKNSLQLCQNCYTEYYKCYDDYTLSLLLLFKIKELSSKVDCLRREKYNNERND